MGWIDKLFMICFWSLRISLLAMLREFPSHLCIVCPVIWNIVIVIAVVLLTKPFEVLRRFAASCCSSLDGYCLPPVVARYLQIWGADPASVTGSRLPREQRTFALFLDLIPSTSSMFATIDISRPSWVVALGFAKVHLLLVFPACIVMILRTAGFETAGLLSEGVCEKKNRSLSAAQDISEILEGISPKHVGLSGRMQSADGVIDVN